VKAWPLRRFPREFPKLGAVESCSGHVDRSLAQLPDGIEHQSRGKNGAKGRGSRSLRQRHSRRGSIGRSGPGLAQGTPMRAVLTRGSPGSRRFPPRWAPCPFVERREDRLVPAIVAPDAIEASLRGALARDDRDATASKTIFLSAGDLAIDASGG
jgi:hypothetical protein